MGWLYTAYDNKLSHKERREIMDNQYTWENDSVSCRPLASTIKNNTYYGAIERTDKVTGKVDVICAISMLGMYKEGWTYWYGSKDLDETCGFGKYDCPIKIINMLTPIDSEWANEWRAKCLENATKPSLSKLPVGTVIKFLAPFDCIACDKGTPVVLEKKCRTVNWATGRKTYSWSDGCYRWKTSQIPTDFEVIKEG